MRVRYRRFVAAETDLLARFLNSEDWCHAAGLG